MPFMGFIKQSQTGFSLKIGPLLDSSGAPVTGLSLVAADAKISKAGGAFTSKTGSNPIEDAFGVYDVPVTSTDLNTTGRFALIIEKTGSLPWRGDWTILNGPTFDALISGTADLLTSPSTAGLALINTEVQNANVTSLGGTGYDVDQHGLEYIASQIPSMQAEQPAATGVFVSVAAASGGSQVLTLNASDVDTGTGTTDQYKDMIMYLRAGPGAPQQRLITANDTSAHFTVTPAFSPTPDNTTTYAIDYGNLVPNPPNLDVAVSTRASATAMTTAQTSLTAINADTDNIQTRLPAALTAGGRMDSDAVAISGSTTAADNVEANIANLNATVSSRSTFDGTSVDSVTDVVNPVTVGTNNDKTGYELSSGAIQDFLTTVMTESYAADEAEFSLAQALYEICQLLEEPHQTAPGSTTINILKRDGSTVAFTLEADDADTPSTLTRTA